MKPMITALVAATLLWAGPVQAADQNGANAKRPYELPEGSAFVHTEGIAAPLYHKKRQTAYIHYAFALVVVDEESATAMRTKRPRIRETILDALNRFSFAQRHAPTRINIPKLKAEILARTQKLFGRNVVLRVLVTQVRPT